MNKSQFNVTLKPLLRDLLGERILFDEPLACHTTLKIGGPAWGWAQPASAEELRALMDMCKAHGCAYVILGGGSNILAESTGFEGVAIHLASDAMSNVEVFEGHLVAGAAASLRSVVEESLKAGYVSLSFLGGIPGTIGGAVAMNAGTHERWIGPFVESVECIDLLDGHMSTVLGSEIAWDYRSSSLRDSQVVTSVKLGPLKQGDVIQARAEQKLALDRRKVTQPLEFPNAGSIFRNPDGASSGALIESCGLKGFSVGGASVSKKHANFIINAGDATSNDVRALISLIQEKVYVRYGIRLTTEIRFLSE